MASTNLRAFPDACGQTWNTKRHFHKSPVSCSLPVYNLVWFQSDTWQSYTFRAWKRASRLEVSSAFVCRCLKCLCTTGTNCKCHWQTSSKIRWLFWALRREDWFFPVCVSFARLVFLFFFFRGRPAYKAVPVTKCQPGVFHLRLHCYARASWRLSLRNGEITHKEMT